MGLLTVLKKMKKKEKEMRLLLLGLDNAGKTTILKRFNGEDIHSVSPTLGFNIKTFDHNNYKLNVWDVGGQKSLRSYWKNYFECTDGVIWVVDSADKRRLEDCAVELHSLLLEEVPTKDNVTPSIQHAPVQNDGSDTSKKLQTKTDIIQKFKRTYSDGNITKNVSRSAVKVRTTYSLLPQNIKKSPVSSICTNMSEDEDEQCGEEVLFDEEELDSANRRKPISGGEASLNEGELDRGSYRKPMSGEEASFLSKEGCYHGYRVKMVKGKRRFKSQFTVMKALEYNFDETYPDMGLLVKKKKNWDFENPSYIRAMYVESETNLINHWKSRYAKFKRMPQPKIKVRNNKTANLKIQSLQTKIINEQNASKKYERITASNRTVPVFSSVQMLTNETTQQRHEYIRNKPTVPGHIVEHFARFKKPPFKFVKKIPATRPLIEP